MYLSDGIWDTHQNDYPEFYLVYHLNITIVLNLMIRKMVSCDDK
jgi:hypothetical protein